VRHKLAEPAPDANQDQLYQEAASTFGAALVRIARAYEADPHRRQDLLQDIHLALWRSFVSFRQACMTPGDSGLLTSVVGARQARRTDYGQQDTAGSTGRDATNLPTI
jgi:hypothetical protein